MTITTEGGKADIAKPLKAFGSGVIEIAVRYRTDAWRVVYVTELAGRRWAIHAFRLKSKTGMGTPKTELDLIGSRLARLRRELKACARATSKSSRAAATCSPIWTIRTRT